MSVKRRGEGTSEISGQIPLSVTKWIFGRPLKANFQSVEFSERPEILLFTRENVALKLNRLLRLSNISLSKIPPARDIPLTGNWPLERKFLWFCRI